MTVEAGNEKGVPTYWGGNWNRSLTVSLYEEPKQRVCSGHGLAEVVVVVDGEQVAVDVRVANHHLHVYPVNVQDELVELLKLPGLEAVHGKPPELGPILERRRHEQSKLSSGVTVVMQLQKNKWGVGGGGEFSIVFEARYFEHQYKPKMVDKMWQPRKRLSQSCRLFKNRVKRCPHCA